LLYLFSYVLLFRIYRNLSRFRALHFKVFL
jgi:hypothetical protein